MGEVKFLFLFIPDHAHDHQVCSLVGRQSLCWCLHGDLPHVGLPLGFCVRRRGQILHANEAAIVVARSSLSPDSPLGVLHLFLLLDCHFVNHFVFLHAENFFTFLTQKVQDEHGLHVSADLRDGLRCLRFRLDGQEMQYSLYYDRLKD